MDLYRMLKILGNQNLIPFVMKPENKLQYGYNKVRMQSKYESFDHFIVKATLAKLIYNMGDGLVTEWVLPNADKVDVLQVKKNSIIGYEIYKTHRPTRTCNSIDWIEVDINSCPKTVKQAINVLKTYFQDIVV